MKMINAGTANILNYAPYSRNCNLGQCGRHYLAPIPSLYDVQLFVNFGTMKPTGFEFTIIDLCNPSRSAVVTSGIYLIANNGVYWYGIFKNFSSSADYSSFIISLTTGAQTFFSEQYQLPSECDTLVKVNVCYPYNYNAEDTNGIYIGEPDLSKGYSGLPTIFYHHNFWTRQGEIVETQNKITFTSNAYKNFATTLNKSYEFRPELVPGWYKDYLLSVYFRGDILINGVHALVTEINFDDVDVDYWKAYAVLGKQVKGGFGCAPFVCVDDVIPPPPPPPPCVPVSYTINSLGSPVVGFLYSKTVAITGDTPLTLTILDKPDWLTNVSITGSTLIIEGTPATGDIGTANLSFNISNACGQKSFTGSITVNPAGAQISGGDTPVSDDACVSVYELTVTANDGDSLTISSSVAHGYGTAEPSSPITIIYSEALHYEQNLTNANGQGFSRINFQVINNTTGITSTVTLIRNNNSIPC